MGSGPSCMGSSRERKPHSTLGGAPEMDSINALTSEDCDYTEVLFEHDMDQELNKPLKDMAEAITALARHSAGNPPKDDALGTRLSTLEERSNWHRNIGWSIAGLAGSLFAGLITWYLPTQLSNVRDGIKSDTAAQLLPLQIQLAKLTATAALKESKDVAEAIQQSADFSTPRSAIEAVKTIAQRARADKLQTSPSVLKDTNVKIQSAISTDPALIDEGWSATLALVDYRSTLLPANDVSSSRTSKPQNFVLPLAARNSFDGGMQTLDGVHWKDSIFQNMQIVYGGGPIELENVRFINCRFVMKYSPRAETLADMVLAQNEVSGTVS
jgi:hypothetical protein